MRRRALNAPDPPQSNKHSLLQLYVRSLWLRSIGVIQSARTTPKLLSRLMADCTRHECCPPVLIESSFRTLSELVVHSNGVGSANNVEVI